MMILFVSECLLLVGVRALVFLLPRVSLVGSSSRLLFALYSTIIC